MNQSKHFKISRAQRLLEELTQQAWLGLFPCIQVFCKPKFQFHLNNCSSAFISSSTPIFGWAYYQSSRQAVSSSESLASIVSWSYLHTYNISGCQFNDWAFPTGQVKVAKSHKVIHFDSNLPKKCAKSLSFGN